MGLIALLALAAVGGVAFLAAREKETKKISTQELVEEAKLRADVDTLNSEEKASQIPTEALVKEAIFRQAIPRLPGAFSVRSKDAQLICESRRDDISEETIRLMFEQAGKLSSYKTALPIANAQCPPTISIPGEAAIESPLPDPFAPPPEPERKELDEEKPEPTPAPSTLPQETAGLAVFQIAQSTATDENEDIDELAELLE